MDGDNMLGLIFFSCFVVSHFDHFDVYRWGNHMPLYSYLLQYGYDLNWVNKSLESGFFIEMAQVFNFLMSLSKLSTNLQSCRSSFPFMAIKTYLIGEKNVEKKKKKNQTSDWFSFLISLEYTNYLEVATQSLKWY